MQTGPISLKSRKNCKIIRIKAITENVYKIRHAIHITLYFASHNYEIDLNKHLQTANI